MAEMILEKLDFIDHGEIPDDFQQPQAHFKFSTKFLMANHNEAVAFKPDSLWRCTGLARSH